MYWHKRIADSLILFMFPLPPITGRVPSYNLVVGQCSNQAFQLHNIIFIVLVVSNLLFWFFFLAGADKKAEAGAGAATEFQFVSTIAYICTSV